MTSMNDYSLLRSNLSEIYAALHACSDEQPLNLHPLSSSKVCYQGTWMGRAVKWINACWRWAKSFFVASESLRLDQTLEYIIQGAFEQSVRQAWQDRHKHFANQIKWLGATQQTLPQNEKEACLARYRSCLVKEGNGFSPEAIEEALQVFNASLQSPVPDEPESASLRRSLTQFHKATRFFWKIFVKEKYRHKRAPLEPFLTKPGLALTDAALYHSLYQGQVWINLEGLLQKAVPLAALGKINCPETLVLQEKEDLKQWIQALNAHKQFISLKDFEVVLKRIVEVMHVHGQADYTLGRLLLALDLGGCELISQEDARQRIWRGALRPGGQISCNGKVFTLGCQLSPVKEIDDKYQFFSVEGYPDFVVKVADNRFKLVLESEKVRNESEHWGIHPVRLIENIGHDHPDRVLSGLDENGRCSMMEKLPICLADYQWSSQTSPLTEADEKIASVLANHLYCQRQWKATSQNLSPSHLLFDGEGVLKSCRLLKKGPEDYDQWERFCFEASKDNREVLAYLMAVSKLNEHPIACFYREAVSHTLLTGQTNFLTHRQPDGYQDKKYHDRAESLCEAAKQMRSAAFKKMEAYFIGKGSYTHRQENALKSITYQRLMDTYQASLTPGLLPLSLQQQVLDELMSENIALDLNGPVQRRVPQDQSKAYYESQFELIMQKNLLMLEQA